MRTSTRPPRDLGKSGRALWRDVQKEGSYEIRDPAGLALLEVACRALDRMTEAQAVIARDGLVIEKTGRANPAVKIEVDARNGFLAAMRGLHLDVEPLRDTLAREGTNPFQPSANTFRVVSPPNRSARTS